MSRTTDESTGQSECWERVRYELPEHTGALPKPGEHVAVFTAVGDSPVATLADDVVRLPYADERSVVQTRFPTTRLLLLLLGQVTDRVLNDVVMALETPIDLTRSLVLQAG